MTLLLFYNVIWKTYIPSEWRKATIIPILKPQKPADSPSSYRPIALTNASCKLMERIIVNRLKFFLEINSKISDFQAGFREKRSTIEQAAFLSQNIKDGFHCKKSTLAVYVDFRAAYDSIWIKKLVQKVSDIGICGRMFNWIKSFLCQRHARVRYKLTTSKFVQMRNGLPQGAVISCFLFNIMINDLIEELRSIPDIQCLAFADDLTIFSTGQNIETTSININKAMLILEEWCRENQMTVNTEKTVYQLFTLSTRQHSISIKYKNYELSRQDHFRYLGVILDNKLSWRMHAEENAKKGENRLSLLKRLAGVTWGSSPDVLATTYKSYIRPILDYGGELLATASDSCGDKIDKVQNKALRLITAAACSTPIAALEIQTNLEPMKARRKKQLLKQYEKCKRLPLDHWRNYVPTQRRLKTHHSFFSKSEDLQNHYNLNNEPRQSFYLEGGFPPTLGLPASVLEIDFHEKKSDAIPAALRAHALKAIATRYPRNKWLHIYTDGSAQEDQSAGAGFYCENLFEGSCAVGLGATNYEAEIEAVGQASSHVLLSTTSLRSAVFLVDSQSAIYSLCSPCNSYSERVERTKEKINTLNCAGWTVVFQWIPSHCDIPGNERADSLAKHGCSLPQPSVDISYRQAFSSISSATNNNTQRDYQNEAKGKLWENLLNHPIPMNLPRRVFAANFRILTGHDYLQGHLHRIGVKDTPYCPLCTHGQTMDFKHLTNCAFLTNTNFNLLPLDNYISKADLYWAVRREMASTANSSM